MLAQAMRMMRRDWRAGELHFLLLALVVAVAALSAVGFFIDRLAAGLQRDAGQLLGADVVVNADQPIDPAWQAEARRRGLTLAQTVAFPSMALGTGDDARSRLVSLKAVSAGYPLRGTVKLRARALDAGAGEVAAPGIPAPGSVWVDPDVLSALALAPGQELQLGDARLRIAGVISVEPDRGSAFINFAPRVMLALPDLAATQLVQDGSRVTYRLLVAGAPPQVRGFQQWVEARIEAQRLRGVRIESLETGRPEMRSTLDRAHQFLSLVGLLAALLAAVAVAMAARRFARRHLDGFAMLRCLGLSQGQVTRLVLYEFLLLGLAAGVIGVVLGFGAHFVLLEWLGSLVATRLPPAGWLPALQGVAVGLLLLIGFALPPVLQLRNVPHNRVIRREQEAPKPLALATYGSGVAAFAALLLWQAGDPQLGLLTVAGFLGGFVLFALIGWLALKTLRPLRDLSSAAAWRFALTALQRRPGATVVQIVALALGLMSLLLLTVVRGDLIGAWRASTPADAPNRFVINIQPDQRAGVLTMLGDGGVAAPQLYPMIRGRLVRINGVAVGPDTYQDERAQRLVNREFNLSTMADLPPQNTIVAGHWYDDSKPEASVEQGLAKTLGLKLGDRLQFDVGGQMVEAPVTSLRALDWGSMRVNFFVIINPAAMHDMPQTLITAFHLPPESGALGDALTRAFPNLTVVDIGSILRQIQSVLDQVIGAVEFLFLFTLTAGALVLYAALLGSQEERIREAALLRALGATRRQLSRAQWIEFTLIGALAGVLAASGAAAIGWALAHYVFRFEWHFSPLVWAAGGAVGIVCAFVGGWIGLRNVLTQPPLQSLRDG